jgi:hypothetical protein
VAVEAQAAGLRVFASDAVPKECVVVPDLVSFLPLTAGANPWARKVLESLSESRPNHMECNMAVRSSAFSIENSASSLLRIYAAK